MIGRGNLRLLLGALIWSASRLEFVYDEFGKPGLITAQGLPVQFNVSHSGDLIFIAITRGRAVGIDVERIRTDVDVEQVAARFFSGTNARL